MVETKQRQKAARSVREVKPLYIWHSACHVALLYGKMTKQPFTIEELREFSTKFPKNDRFRLERKMDQALTNGHVVRVGNGWAVTEMGAAYLRAMASMHRFYSPLPAEDLDDDLSIF